MDKIIYHEIYEEDGVVFQTFHYNPEMTDEKLKEIYKLVWKKVISIKYRDTYTSVIIKVDYINELS